MLARIRPYPNVGFGSLAASLHDFSLMSASERKAGVRLVVNVNIALG